MSYAVELDSADLNDISTLIDRLNYINEALSDLYVDLPATLLVYDSNANVIGKLNADGDCRYTFLQTPYDQDNQC